MSHLEKSIILKSSFLCLVSSDMIPIIKRTYESLENGHLAISKLDWKVEKVSRLTNPFLNNATVDTAKPWVGRIDKETNDFEITPTAPYLSPQSMLEGNFFLLVLTGRIIEQDTKCKIEIEFRLGWTALATLTLLYLFPILGIVSIIQNGPDGLQWLITFIFPLAATLLLVLQLNRTENKLMALFEV